MLLSLFVLVSRAGGSLEEGCEVTRELPQLIYRKTEVLISGD